MDEQAPAPSLKLKTDDAIKVAEVVGMVYPPARAVAPILRAAKTMGLKEIDIGNMAATKGLGKVAGPSVLGQDGFLSGARAIGSTGPKGRISRMMSASADILNDDVVAPNAKPVNEQLISMPFPDPY